MIEAGAAKPTLFDIVLVHSFSRFFRDHFELEFYVRKLAKNGIKLVSITQEIGDDPMHVMVRQTMALFDEYQFKENGKHTLRAMKENARQGFWHGDRPPIGYRVVAVAITTTCSIEARQSETPCKGRSIPIEKLDDLVAGHIEERLAAQAEMPFPSSSNSELVKGRAVASSRGTAYRAGFGRSCTFGVAVRHLEHFRSERMASIRLCRTRRQAPGCLPLSTTVATWLPNNIGLSETILQRCML